MNADLPFYMTSAYCFVPLEAASLESLRIQILTFMESEGVLGHVVLAPEGVNFTVSGSESGVAGFRALIVSVCAPREVRFKDWTSDVRPSTRRIVSVRREIVGLKRPDLVPSSDDRNHLSPAEWHAMITSGQPVRLLDTRNDYEISLGKFKGATDIGLSHFSDWSARASEASLDDSVPLLIYCTGGIRCEKVMLDLETRGLKNVYQLRDGILGYLAEFPDGEFEGECFVYDDRVAVDSSLAPSKVYGICAGCGLPFPSSGSCLACGERCFTCASCLDSFGMYCSKTCRTHSLQSS